jgi:hypothetical protein
MPDEARMQAQACLDIVDYFILYDEIIDLPHAFRRTLI